MAMLTVMNVVTTSNLKLYPDQALAALERLETLLATSGHDGEVIEPMRLVPGKRALFLGRLDGQDVVFRLPLDEAARTGFAREWGEVTRAYSYMSAPPLSVVKPLHFDPDTGLMVIAHVPGTPLFTHLRRAAPETCQPLIARAADWLNAYTAPTTELKRLNFRRWHNKAHETAENQPHPALREIEARILRRMKRLGRALHETECRTAISHGDFHLNNLILNETALETALVGIDTGGSGRMPIIKDIARALTHMARRASPFSGARHFGVDAAAFHSFADAFDMSPLEREAHLPFFIAFETLIKVEHPQMPEHRLAKAETLARTLFRELKQIT